MASYDQLSIPGTGPKPKRRRQKPEEAWKLQVLGIAGDTGWLIDHTPDALYALAASVARKQPTRAHLMPPKGRPDLLLARRELDGTVRVIFAELKSKEGSVSPEQRAWLDLLADVAGVECYVWKPRDLEAVHVILARRQADELAAAA